MAFFRVNVKSKNRFSLNLKELVQRNKASRAIIRDARVSRQNDGRYRIFNQYEKDIQRSFQGDRIFFVNVRFVFSQTIVGTAEDTSSDKNYRATFIFQDQLCKRVGFDTYPEFSNFNWTESIQEAEVDDEFIRYGFTIERKNGFEQFYEVECL